MIRIPESLQDYYNTVEEHKQAIKDIIAFIGNEAFQSGNDIRDWLDSFGYGRDNMMWPIPTIVENNCEICCTFYYLPQIRPKSTAIQFPERLPLPPPPLNVTWENNIPRLEFNWQFELFPHPPVTICWRKNKPECQPEEPPPSCRPLDANGVPMGINTTRPTEWREPIENIPICNPYDDLNGAFLNSPPSQSGRVVKAIIYAQGFRLYWGIQQQKFNNLGGYISTDVVYQYSPPERYKIREIEVVTPVEVRHFTNSGQTGFQGQLTLNRQLLGNYHAFVSIQPVTGDLNSPPSFMRSSSSLVSYSFLFIDFEGDRVTPNPPPETKIMPPPINEVPPMDCCEEVLKIVRDIQRDMKRLMKWTGADKDGVMFPEYIQNQEEQGWLERAWDLITPDEKRHIKSIPEYWKYSMEKMMEILGVPPYKVEDSQGNQLGFPNVASLLTNQINKQIKLQEGVDLVHLALAKDLLETGLTRQQLIFATSLISAICDWGNIELKERQTEVIHQFAFPRDQDVSPEEVDTYKEFDDFLKTTTWNTKEAIFDSEKDLGNGKKPEHFGDVSRRLLKIVEILNAVHGIRIDPNDIPGSVRKFVNEYRKFSKGQALDGKVIGDDDENDTSNWAKKVESEFATETNPPVGSGETPWGNVTGERPRIIIRGEAPTEPDDME